jgi:hypothetical protein
MEHVQHKRPMAPPATYLLAGCLCRHIGQLSACTLRSTLAGHEEWDCPLFRFLGKLCVRSGLGPSLAPSRATIPAKTCGPEIIIEPVDE